ncbi:MAG: leucyl aminopeptidase [Acidobacteria bacterium]|nr:leucyl aminopeptidase [Acidobacteriota bacterium]NIM62114.1 leucyl aminopeptidase [Acidobacteriota bacterium]NIO59746.1 leucyl aminopeptidase [Acidobacteriota bacterium]NIQ30829.1 leucyl aminopeptidase [Acidobacteriota bacterium]NIQ85902.1 leucyl aminopeptidase [Acidobacteriota bacterium]
MRIRVTSNDLSKARADVAVCFAHEGDRAPLGLADAGLRNELGRQMKAVGFRGGVGDRLSWSSNGKYATPRFLVLGLGPDRGRQTQALRAGVARAARQAARVRAKRLAIAVPGLTGESSAAQARAAVEGVKLGNYRFEKYIHDTDRKHATLLAVELCGPSRPASARSAVRRAEISADAVCFARDLVNEAPSRMTPSVMARAAARQAKRYGMRCKVLGKAELSRLGMRALLNVSRGSTEPPKVVHLVCKPKAKARKKVVLVGKGVTFDSGGLNLKPTSGMLTMKADMAGAAAVLSAMTSIAQTGCRAEVHGLLGLVENMTGGDAYKPGDILDTYAGKTVEVGNTDAEGRLVMCDLLAWAAAKLKPDCMVDVATLTGAVVVALGTEITGLFTRDEKMRDGLLTAAGDAGEKIWQLPLPDEYLALLQHGPADLHNVGGRWGGAITAALFLGEFVPRELPWAHLDIAGPAFAETAAPERDAGATGAGTATLIRWLESL